MAEGHLTRPKGEEAQRANPLGVILKFDVAKTAIFRYFYAFTSAFSCLPRGCCVPPIKKGGRKRAVSPQCEVRLKMATADFAIMRLTRMTAQPHFAEFVFFQTWRQKF